MADAMDVDEIPSAGPSEPRARGKGRSQDEESTGKDLSGGKKRFEVKKVGFSLSVGRGNETGLVCE